MSNQFYLFTSNDKPEVLIGEDQTLVSSVSDIFRIF